MNHPGNRLMVALWACFVASCAYNGAIYLEDPIGGDTSDSETATDTVSIGDTDSDTSSAGWGSGSDGSGSDAGSDGGPFYWDSDSRHNDLQPDDRMKVLVYASEEMDAVPELLCLFLMKDPNDLAQQPETPICFSDPNIQYGLPFEYVFGSMELEFIDFPIYVAAHLFVQRDEGPYNGPPRNGIDYSGVTPPISVVSGSGLHQQGIFLQLQSDN